jgi:hypothetical protein
MTWLIQAVIALGVAAAAGAWGYYYAPPGTVESIRITKLSSMPELRMPGKPDYYLLLQLHSGEKLQLPTYRNRPIGNGLVWTLPDPVLVNDIAEVQLFDANRIFRDEMLDRAIVTGRALKSTQHGFDLLGSESNQWTLALAVGVPAAVYGLFCLIMLARWQAIPPSATRRNVT